MTFFFAPGPLGPPPGHAPGFFTLFSILKDNCILLNGKDYLNLITFFNVELGRLSILLRANKLSLNVQKTYYMVFHRAKIKIDNDVNITMNSDCLKRTNILKYLCVIIDHKLNWTQHIAHVKNKVSRGIGIMYRARSYFTKNSLKKLHFSCIYPYLTYFIEI